MIGTLVAEADRRTSKGGRRSAGREVRPGRLDELVGITSGDGSSRGELVVRGDYTGGLPAG